MSAVVPRKHIQESCFNPDTCGGTCYGCTIAVCKVCGAYEGGLTTECPGTQVDADTVDRVYKTDLNFIGGEWKNDGSDMRSRGWLFDRGGRDNHASLPCVYCGDPVLVSSTHISCEKEKCRDREDDALSD